LPLTGSGVPPGVSISRRHKALFYRMRETGKNAELKRKGGR